MNYSIQVSTPTIGSFGNLRRDTRNQVLYYLDDLSERDLECLSKQLLLLHWEKQYAQKHRNVSTQTLAERAKLLSGLLDCKPESTFTIQPRTYRSIRVFVWCVTLKISKRTFTYYLALTKNDTLLVTRENNYYLDKRKYQLVLDYLLEKILD